jgi:3D (Asp-Asp-Asp) domain-containing protein
MRRVLSRSTWLKVAVLMIAVVGFVLLYEAEMFDSRKAVWQSMTNENGSPLPGARLPFNATAYCKGTTTASGVVVRTGIAAADPTLLPVGSVLNIAAGDNRYSGVYTVMDTGPKVQGRTLDLYMWSCHEALKFGRRDIEVTVLRLGWDPRASAPSIIDRLFRRREASRKVPPEDPPPPAGVPPDEDVLPEATDAPHEGETPETIPPAVPTTGSTPTTSTPAAPLAPPA